MLNYHKTFFFQVFKLDILSPACVIFLYFYILSNYNNNKQKTKTFRAELLLSNQNTRICTKIVRNDRPNICLFAQCPLAGLWSPRTNSSPRAAMPRWTVRPMVSLSLRSRGRRLQVIKPSLN